VQSVLPAELTSREGARGDKRGGSKSWEKEKVVEGGGDGV